MVYESDFYTTRRPYRATPSLSTYTVTRRQVPWEKVPFVPRPSLVPDPVTAFGKRKPDKPKALVDKVTITALERESIKPKAHLEPLRPYQSARDLTREKVLANVKKHEAATVLPQSEDVDVLLARMHKVSEMQNLPYKRKLVMASYRY